MKEAREQQDLEEQVITIIDIYMYIYIYIYIGEGGKRAAGSGRASHHLTILPAGHAEVERGKRCKALNRALIGL